eukprot:CAMPEP_0184479430 /NCGR_PEP_ID=MMETSP0113_2-20130426/1160_1 /TAXON_ID=91329 /ORGANISM="Norrisiella sphaerica, Strain BC52" /LENGTH=516 /DNA_ID=CAMNT_0026857515 /DNA_START=132 /DNA_END=1682 /DNA_ORIENTATION=-
MKKVQAKISKRALSKLATTEKGGKLIEEAIGPEATQFLKHLNDGLQKQSGEKLAKKTKDNIYRMLVKFNSLEREGKLDPELRYRVDKDFNSLARQGMISLQVSHNEEEPRKAELAALKIAFETMTKTLVALVTGNMRPKNVETLKEVMDQVSNQTFMMKLLFDKHYAEIRKSLKSMMDKMFQDLMENTGEEWADTRERQAKMKKEAEKKSETLQAPSSGLDNGLGGAQDKKPLQKPCAVVSCGSDAVYAEATFHGSPFCSLHHFKAYPEFNQGTDVQLADWLNDAERRRVFTRFIELRDKDLMDCMSLYNRVKNLNEEKDGKNRSKIASNILNVLVQTAGDQLTDSIRKKIQNMITEEEAPTWIFDSILPRLQEKLQPIYIREFVKTSAYQVVMQTARLPEKHRDELAWQLSAHSRNDKGTGIGFNLGTAKKGDEKDGKTPAKIDTNAVLQPFAVEKDRSPTIRRLRPGEEEEEMEALDLANGIDDDDTAAAEEGKDQKAGGSSQKPVAEVEGKGQ